MALRKFATLGGVSIAGLALIGAGAMATFTQDTTSSQTVTAGTMNVVLSHNGGAQSQTLTLPALGPTGSTFVMGPNMVKIENLGNIPANEVRIQITDANNNATLQSQVFACLYSNGSILFNQPLTVAESYGSIAVGTQLIPPPDFYTLVLYAGSGAGAYNGCGATSTSISGGAFQPGGPTYVGAVPVMGVNPAAASLTNPAQGGSLQVNVTVSYEG